MDILMYLLIAVYRQHLRQGIMYILRELYTLQEMQRIKECMKLLKEVKSCLLM